MKPYRMQLVWIAVAGVGCSLANVGVVGVLKQLIDSSVSEGLTGRLWKILIGALGVILIGLASNYLVVKLTGYMGAGILWDMRNNLVNHMGKIAPNNLEKQNFGDVMERMSSDVATVAGYLQTYFKDCLYVPIVVVVFGIYLFSMHPLLAAVCLGPLIIMVPLNIVLLKPVKLAQAEYVKGLGLTNNHIQEAFDGAEVIKSYNLQKTRGDKYFEALKKTLDISNKNDLWQYNIEPLSSLIKEAPTAIALCVGGYLALKGEVSFGVLVAFITGIEKINEPLVYAYQLVIRTQLALVSAKRVFELLDMPVESAGEMGDTFKKKSSCVFELKKVSFAHSEQKILDDLSLCIEEGKKIALVGHSGSGKSTLLKLLCRLHEAEEGEISFYGNLFRDVKPEAIRSRVALISQEAVIFPMSVRDNIRMGNPDAPEEKIVEAAKKAGCHEFIMALPKGYDTLLEEKGRNLSGGQRQRISIARAILKDVKIYLLDEPTSALDKETEAHVNETLLKICENKTMITVAHRLNTIVSYDEILVLEKGKIVERGTHATLMGAEGKYYQLYEQYIRSGEV